MQVLREAGQTIRRLWRLIVLFVVLRLTVGLAIIVLFDREAAAWGYRATLILAAAFAVCVGVALALRRWRVPSRDAAS